jgi:hypothetical protein
MLVPVAVATFAADTHALVGLIVSQESEHFIPTQQCTPGKACQKTAPPAGGAMSPCRRAVVCLSRCPPTKVMPTSLFAQRV